MVNVVVRDLRRPAALVRSLRGVALLAAVLGSAVCTPSHAFAQAQSVSLTASNVATAGPGDLVEVSVTLGDLINVSSLHAFKIALAYDAAVLAPVSVVPGAALANWPVSDFASADGMTGFAATGLTTPAVAISDGEMLRFTFEVVQGAFDAAVSPLAIVGTEPGEPAVLLDTPNSVVSGIKVAAVSSRVTVVGGTPCTAGDASVDGTVDVADAVLVLRSVAGLTTLDPQAFCNADTDRDGTVDVGDAVRILNTVVGLARFATTPVPGSAVARLERDADGARLVIEAASGLYGLESVLRTGRDLSIGDLAAAPTGLRVTGADRTLHRIAWAATEELALGANALVIDLPLRGEGGLELVSVRGFAADGSPVELSVEGGQVPEGGRVTAVRMSNHPNPFNPSTQLQFELPRRGFVRVELFNASGQRVRVLVDGELEAGAHGVVWNGTDDTGRTVASGVYFARLSSEMGEAKHRLLMLK